MGLSMLLAQRHDACGHPLVVVPRKKVEDLSSPFASSVHFTFSGPGDCVFLQSLVNIGEEVAGEEK